jgi:5-(carboxyamino)imidazole ribonucleotide synthase
MEDRIIEASKEFMIQANYYGILTIEYFVKGDKFYFNEMAPRPHNSGHYTIEGCTTNQFKELDKFLLSLPLEKPKLISATCMKNILGRDLVNLEKLKNIKNSNYHDYQKDQVKPLRKLGHITYTNTTLDLLRTEFKKQNIGE